MNDHAVENVELLPPTAMAQQGTLPRDAAAQAPWPQPQLQEPVHWDVFASFPNFWEGQILGGLLNNEGVPAIVDFTWPDFGGASCSVVRVPRELAHRARWILAWPAPTEAELTFLATGEMGP